MGALTGNAAETYREYEVDGVPSSGPNEPDKGAIIALWAQADAAMDLVASAVTVGTATVAATQAALYAITAPAANELGFVWDDATAANNGIYVKTGAAGSAGWSLTGLTLPGTVTTAIQGMLSSANAAATAAAASQTAAAGSATAAAASSTTASNYATSAGAFAGNAAASATLAGLSASQAVNAAEILADAALVAGGGGVFLTYAAANAAVGTLTNGAMVQVLTDETHSGDRTVYKVASGALVFQVDLSPSGQSNTQLTAMFNAMAAAGLFANFQGI